MTRTEQVAWIPFYLDDIDADFRVFYRIDGVADGRFGGLDAARFVQLAERLPAYRGALRARAEAELAELDRAPGRPAPARAAHGSGSGGQVRHIGASRAELMTDPALSSVIDFG